MRILHFFRYLTLLFAGILLLHSCTENVDTSARYVFQHNTVVSYLQKHPEVYSTYTDLLFQLPVSEMSQTTVGQLLTARGHYTVFAPTNQAIQDYLDSLVVKGLIAYPSFEAFEDSMKFDSIRKVIVYNSIIDCGDNIEPFEVGDFPTTQDADLLVSNMYDRKLTVHYLYDADENVTVNGCLIDQDNRDIRLLNGVMHRVHQVIAPSNDTMGDRFKDIIGLKQEGFYVTALLADACGLIDTLRVFRDDIYEKKKQQGLIQDYTFINHWGWSPAHRYVGFSCFAEPDSFWTAEIGKPATEISVQDVIGYLEANNVYPEATRDENYTDEKNLLNQFVTYHYLPGRIARDRLVYHFSEKGYSNGNLGASVMDYYTTMGKRRLLKTFESRQSNGVYLNRFPILDNGRKGTYQEVSCPVDRVGVHVGDPDLNNENNIRNGIIYPIDKLLVYDEATRQNLQKQRIRWDLGSIFPELWTNSLRNYQVDQVYVPNSFDEYPYLANVTMSTGTLFYYWPSFHSYVQNMMEDEFDAYGDVTFRIPPVPRKGTYELRIGVSPWGNRAITQFYWGDDLDKLPPTGIPLDLRQGAKYLHASTDIPCDTGYEPDTGDDAYDQEIDHQMKNKGFMKGPEQYSFSGGTLRYYERTNRRILVTAMMDPDKTYYLRLRNAMGGVGERREIFLDYFEYCAKEVYDNPNEPEDIW